MNRGCSTTTPRPNAKVRNGTGKVLLVRRKHPWADPRWKLRLLFFFSTAVALCTKNIYLQDRELITPSTKMSCWTSKTGPASPKDIADDWVLHHDNAPAHTALSIRESLAKKNIPVLPHPPYNTDLAPCDFYLFPKLKSKLKGHHFGTMENIFKKNYNRWATLTENDFRYCYD